jgi:hypothetical protein
LLDVQLEIGRGVVELAARLRRADEVDAVLGEASGSSTPSPVRELPQLLLVVHRPGRGARAEQAAAEARALLVGPVDEPDGDARSAFLAKAAQHLDATHHVQAAVEPAAVRYRVDVAADQQLARSAPAQREHWLPAWSISSSSGSPASFPRSHSRARSHVSVHATRCAPFSSPVSCCSSRSSSTVLLGCSGTSEAYDSYDRPMGESGAVDWVRWHEAYEEGGRLERRLACVQERSASCSTGARPG